MTLERNKPYKEHPAYNSMDWAEEQGQASLSFILRNSCTRNKLTGYPCKTRHGNERHTTKIPSIRGVPTGLAG